MRPLARIVTDRGAKIRHQILMKPVTVRTPVPRSLALQPSAEKDADEELANSWNDINTQRALQDHNPLTAAVPYSSQTGSLM